MALLALQGPQAVDRAAAPGARRRETGVHDRRRASPWHGCDCFITRSGYTGEDGFEISVPAAQADALARALLAQPEVKPVGLGARNSLRLEAGLCLYGNDIDTTTTPVEASLNWAMQKVRRTGGARAGGFPGADKVLAQLDDPASLTRKRVGLIALERIPVRDHTELQSTDGTAHRRSHQRPARPHDRQARGHGLCRRPNSPPSARACNAMVRGKPVPMEVTRHAFRAHPLLPRLIYPSLPFFIQLSGEHP